MSYAARRSFERASACTLYLNRSVLPVKMMASEACSSMNMKSVWGVFINCGKSRGALAFIISRRRRSELRRVRCAQDYHQDLEYLLIPYSSRHSWMRDGRFVCVMLGVKDDVKSMDTLRGEPFAQVLERLQSDDVWPSDTTKTLWTTKALAYQGNAGGRDARRIVDRRLAW